MRTNVSFDQKRITTENEIATNCIPMYCYVEPNSPVDNFMNLALFSRLHLSCHEIQVRVDFLEIYNIFQKMQVYFA